MTGIPTRDADGRERGWRSLAGPPPDWSGLQELEPLARQFIDLRMHLGCRFHQEGEILLRLVRFLKERAVTKPDQITATHVMSFFDMLTHLRPTTWNRYLSSIGHWFDHLKAIGKLERNPRIFLHRMTREEFIPYIFSGDELRKIVRPDSADPLRQDRAVAYHLIYACGLRISEAAKLEVRDLRRKEGTIFIRRSKFSKDRLVPVHPVVFARLLEYLDRRRGGPGVLREDAPVFVTQRMRRWRGTHLSNCFRLDLEELGIYRPSRAEGGVVRGSPRVHSLRHTMAVHRLLRWYKEGADVQAKLPLLATYLGHANWKYSQLYLKITALVLREADRRFGRAMEKELPLEP